MCLYTVARDLLDPQFVGQNTMCEQGQSNGKADWDLNVLKQIILSHSLEFGALFVELFAAIVFGDISNKDSSVFVPVITMMFASLLSPPVPSRFRY